MLALALNKMCQASEIKKKQNVDRPDVHTYVLMSKQTVRGNIIGKK